MIPVCVVGLREVHSQVNAARFLSQVGCSGHYLGDDQHVLQFPSAWVVELLREDVSAPCFDRFDGILQPSGITSHADISPHEAFQRVSNVTQVEWFAGRSNGLGQVDRFKTIGRCKGSLGRIVTGSLTVYESFQQTVRCQTVCAVEATARYFAGSPQIGYGRSGRLCRRRFLRSCSVRLDEQGYDRW